MKNFNPLHERESVRAIWHTLHDCVVLVKKTICTHVGLI